jgi:RNA polymerase sigma factor (sigma-70 family)
MFNRSVRAPAEVKTASPCVWATLAGCTHPVTAHARPTYWETTVDQDDSDEGLMQRFIDGDAGAFDVLFERYGAPLHGYLWRLLGDRALVDDLTQTTFLSLVRARGRFRPGARFRPWLYAIATNAARDHLRRTHERLTATGELPADAASEEAPEPDAPLDAAVQRALAQLPESWRTVVVMHRFEELPFAEIAEVLGTTEGAVKVRAHRGYERLRELLGDVYKELT